jgi:beta-lactamase regulating signal transducer with metallopeptidase domain
MITSAEWFVVSLIAKATAIFVTGAGIAFLTRKKSASAQRAVWALTLAAAISLPAGMLLTPAWRVAVLPSGVVTPSPGSDYSAVAPEQATVESVASDAQAETQPAVVAPSLASVKPAALRSEYITTIILSIWAVGAIAVIFRLMFGVLALKRVVNRSVPLVDAEWPELLLRERALVGVERPVRILASEDVSTPLTTGLVAPVILLPQESVNWTAEHRAVVLRHEMAHIASGDIGACLVAALACAIYWFHPMAWIATARLRRAQERACDNQVLTLGITPVDYAGHLLEVARSAREMGMSGLVSVAMARPSQLEGRLLAVLNESGDRAGLKARTRVVGVTAAAALMLSVSAFSPVKREPANKPEPATHLIQQSFVPVATRDVRGTGFGSAGGEKTSMSPAGISSGLPVVVGMQSRISDSTIVQDLEVPPRGTLTLDLETGAGLTIRGTKDSRIHMRATLGGRDWRRTEVSLVRDEAGARLTMRWTGSNTGGSSSHRVELTIPEEYNISLKSAGGGLDLTDVHGVIGGSTGGGNLKIERAHGSANLSTGGGSVVVMNSDLGGHVSTGGGPVLIQGVTGGLTGTSGTGDVLYGKDGLILNGNFDGNGARGSDGKIYVRKSGGSVSYGYLGGGADISTGGGGITIASANGDVRASTGGGDIRIGTVSGSADLTTGAGDVTVSVTGSAAHEVKVSSGNGRVVVTIPSNMYPSLDLESGYTRQHGRTRIQSDWSIPITETDEWDDAHGTPRKYVRSRGAIGSGTGGTIRVRTTNGDIVLRRG